MIPEPPIVPPRMPPKDALEYRLYFLDGLGHIQKSHEFSADNDEAAIRISEAWREGQPRLELWERGRIVKRWDSKDQP